MPRIAIICLMSLIAMSSGLGAQSEDREYERLVADLKSGNVDIDYSALRFAFVKTENYNPLGSGEFELRKKMIQAFENEKYSKAITFAEKILDDAYINGDAHVIAGISHKALGHAEHSAYHLNIVAGLLESICPGESGKTPETPCRVISTDEEYWFMQMTGLEQTSQGLTECEYGPCDEMGAFHGESKQHVTIYFDVSTPKGVMDRLWIRE